MPVKNALGTYEWTKQTLGVMSLTQRGRALAGVARGQVVYVADYIRLLTDRPPRRPASDPIFTLVMPPDGPLPAAAKKAWAEQCPQIRAHSYRAWAYGRALACLDGAGLDDRLFYLACLLHDYGLEHPQAGEDFTLRSAERALRCIRELDRPEQDERVVADAITLHVTPGLRPEGDAIAGYYIQAGSLLDLAGSRGAQQG
jgi:hypothetical protein